MSEPFHDDDSERFVARYIERAPLSLEKLSIQDDIVIYTPLPLVPPTFSSLPLVPLPLVHPNYDEKRVAARMYGLQKPFDRPDCLRKEDYTAKMSGSRAENDGIAR